MVVFIEVIILKLGIFVQLIKEINEQRAECFHIASSPSFSQNMISGSNYSEGRNSLLTMV